MLPNLIIIGAQKCATTSLHYYLDLHPQISMSRAKELNFFILEYNRYRDIEWYTSCFTNKTKICGESSPNYTAYPIFSGVPERMYSVLPEVKLIYVLRNPVERIISQYVHYYASEIENRNISDALADLSNDNVYLCRSKYFMQLEQFLNFYPETSILIITMEELYSHRQQTLQRIFRFLNVDDSFFSSRVFHKHKSISKRRKNRIGLFLKQTVGKNIVYKLSPEIREKANTLIYYPFSRNIKRPTLNESIRQRLIDKLKDDINCLRQFTGNDFMEWSS